MRWIIFCILLSMTVPALAETKQVKQSQKKDVKVAEEIPCINHVEDWMKLVTMNPYDNKDRCFQYIGTNVQLLDRTHALFGIMTDRTPFALMDFGDESAPRIIQGSIVKGNGAYTYVTVSGSQNIIHSFTVITEAKLAKMKEQKAAREKADELKRLGPEGVKKKAAEEKRRKEEWEAKESERIANAEEARKAEAENRKKDEEIKKAEEETKRRQLEQQAKEEAERVRLKQIEGKKSAVRVLEEQGIIINDDSDVIIDTKNELMWTKNPKISGKMGIIEAGKWVNGLKINGFADWRIPSIREYYMMLDVKEPLKMTGLNFGDMTFWTSSTISDHNQRSRPVYLKSETGTYYLVSIRKPQFEKHWTSSCC